MILDVGSILVAMTLSMSTAALALVSVMGQVNLAARRGRAASVLQAGGWIALLLSGLPVQGSAADAALSILAMGCISAGLVCQAAAFALWCGHAAPNRSQAGIAIVMTVGYAAGFSDYAFRVGWANGLLALQLVLMVATLVRPAAAPVGRWRWLLVVGLAAQAVVTAWRGVLGAFFTASFPAFMAPHPVNVAFALIVNVTTIVSLVGILLAHRDEAARALERLATVDGLTGVLNRRAWLLQADAELAGSIRLGRPMAVLMIDLDHFKQINDSRGHEAGDRALQFFAGALKMACGRDDIVCRYGGEEFCVLLLGAGEEAVRAFDQRMRQHLKKASVPELGHLLGYSGGMALRAAHDVRMADILRRADRALYRAKEMGRACTVDAAAEPLAAGLA